jgi:methylated-DNA-[protein]-cysteine S-methyltransferase
LREAVAQLDEYFRGRRKEFTLELQLSGTEFQKQVWRELLKIPYGRTVSYGVLAAALGKPGSARAVGGANHRNPVSIVIPCHRVIGADGQLVGYGGGLWRKKWLLAHEKKPSQKLERRTRACGEDSI